MRKPFFKKSHGSWYVHHQGRMVRLADINRYGSGSRKNKPGRRVLVAPAGLERVDLGEVVLVPNHGSDQTQDVSASQ